MFMIQKVGVDERGRVDRVQWQAADTSRNAWVGQPAIVPVAEVVHQVNRGRVGTVFLTGAGSSTQGPYLRTVVDDAGREWVEADDSHGDDRSLLDMPRL